MKKSLIALAVAGTFAAPAAFAATANVDVYGVMNVAIQDTNANNSDIQVTDNFSRIGFKGSEDLGGGLKALWQIESGLGGGTDGMGTGQIGTRNTFIGLSGGFGTVVAGRHDTPYKIATGKYDIFADTIGDYNLGRLNGVQVIHNYHDHRSPNAIAYISPSFSGLTVAGAVVATNNNANLNSNDNVDAVSLALMYANGPLTVDFGWQDVNADLAPGVAGDQDSDAWKLGVGYSFGDIKLGFVFEDVDAGDLPDNRTSWMLSAAYKMGPMTIKATYGDVSDADFGAFGGVDQNMYAIGLDYAMSKRTTAYVVFGAGDSDGAIANVAGVAGGNVIAGSADDTIRGWNIGMRHSF